MGRLIQLEEDLKKNTGISLARDCLWIQATIFPGLSSLMVYVQIWTCQPPEKSKPIPENQSLPFPPSLSVSLSLSLSPFLSLYIYVLQRTLIQFYPTFSFPLLNAWKHSMRVEGTDAFHNFTVLTFFCLSILPQVRKFQSWWSNQMFSPVIWILSPQFWKKVCLFFSLLPLSFRCLVPFSTVQVFSTRFY